jgi:hypothetical protein
MKSGIRLVSLFFLFLFAGSFCLAQKTAFIGIGDPAESQNAFEVLQDAYPTAEALSLDLLSNDYSLLWIHSTDTTGTFFNQGQLKKIKEFIEKGGNLLLTLEAFRLVTDLDLEKKSPGVRYVPAVDLGYGKKLGLHAFIDHPVFNGLHGGAYIWNPQRDTTTRMIGYFDDQIPSGKTVAVDWAYIRMRENSRVLLEYQKSKARILAIGAYTHFAALNNNQEHLKIFMKNCFNYLINDSEVQKKYYWDYSTPKIVEGDSLIGIKKSIPAKWEEKKVLNLKYNFASDNYWDLAGERILVMGKEKGGIDEIWVHPFMALRDYEAGLQFSYKDTIYWLNDQRPQVEISPAYIKRTYQFRRAFLTEVISVDPENPSGVIHYEYRGVFPAKIILKVKSNLRFMWPYSEMVFRKMKFRVGESSVLFQTEDGSLNSVVNISKNHFIKYRVSLTVLIKKILCSQEY